jgi:hypothetical protein
MPSDEAALLSLWEQGQTRSPLDRALLLAWGCGGAAVDEPAALPIGQRDALLLRARIRHFGARLEATADCPHCGACMSFGLQLDELAQAAQPAAIDAHVACAAGHFRLPTSADVAAALQHAEPRQALALALRIEGSTPLDDDALAAIEQALSDVDPAAQIDIALACEACGRPFDAPLDIAECLWLDLSRRARRTLDDVHQLASAYGWSEAEVLAVPPARRQQYLQRVLT